MAKKQLNTSKPSAIIDIEKAYYINLKQIEKVDKIMNLSNNNSFCLNINNEIIGLNLYDSKIADFNPIKKNDLITHLNIGSNPIKNLNEIKELKQLTHLNISDTRINTIDFLKDLTQLTELHINFNYIADINPIKGMKKLQILNAFRNNINDISCVSELSQLKWLRLARNIIETLPKFNLLKQLAYLDIDNNIINDLSSIFELIKGGIEVLSTDNNEKGIYIGNNPLISPPLEIVKLGNEAIIRYIKQIEKQGSETIFEAKVTLVGEGNAGKTSLLKKLLYPEAPLKKEEDRTRGIAIADWEFEAEHNKKHIAHIWDFGGQDVYYPVHRFFLTENSVFVLLASTRQNRHEFDYWIPTIYQFGAASPIILAQTCHDGNAVAWNDIGAFLANEDFNIVRDNNKVYHELNLLKENQGLAQIKKSIIDQIGKLPHINKLVPKSWALVREMIQQMQMSNCVSYNTLKSQIQTSHPTTFQTKEDVADCISFLHDIGSLLWYKKEDQLKDWVVLNPKWAVDAVYKIIDDELIQQQKGIILSTDFERIWNDEVYETHHETLKKMLSVFKIAFPQKSNQKNYIIPTRLESMPSEAIWDKQKICLSMEYNFDFMPKGMVNQVSAELSRYIIADDQVWNNGVNVQNEGSKGQLFEDFYNRKILVKAEGKFASHLMTIIMNAIKDISDGYKGVKPKIVIPCPCEECLLLEEPTTFPYNNLIRLIEKREDASVTCNNSGDSFKIETLLFDYGLPNPMKAKQANKIFISYSHDDIAEKKELKKFLANLERDGIEVWHDDELKAGDIWDEVTQSKLMESDIIIMLISQNFIASNYVHKIEARIALLQKNKGKANIIPVLIEDCDWKHWKIFNPYDKDISPEDVEKGKIGNYQLLPKGDDARLKAISEWEDKKAKAWLQIIDQVRNYCRHF